MDNVLSYALMYQIAKRNFVMVKKDGVESVAMDTLFKKISVYCSALIFQIAKTKFVVTTKLLCVVAVKLDTH